MNQFEPPPLLLLSDSVGADNWESYKVSFENLLTLFRHIWRGLHLALFWRRHNGAEGHHTGWWLPGTMRRLMKCSIPASRLRGKNNNCECACAQSWAAAKGRIMKLRCAELVGSDSTVIVNPDQDITEQCWPINQSICAGWDSGQKVEHCWKSTCVRGLVLFEQPVGLVSPWSGLIYSVDVVVLELSFKIMAFLIDISNTDVNF